MSSNDSTLGLRVHKMLVDRGIETPALFGLPQAPDDIAEHFKSILTTLGMNLEDDSIQDTPKRLGKMWAKEIFYGLDYGNFPRMMAIENKMKFDEVICVKDIHVRSVCEHHFVPFIGKAHVAYIPNNKVVGLSKINRLVDFFCRRPQVQERLNEQIAAAIAFVLETDDVAVIIDSEHFCVKLRGVQDPHSSTSTSKMLGRFRENPTLRAELFSLIGL